MPEYEIKITDAHDLRILTPEMIALLIEKTRSSPKRELHIPAKELLPQGYADYLLRVFKANAEILFGDTFAPGKDNREPVSQNTAIICGNHMENRIHSISVQEVYQLAARQINQLYIQQQLCFETVNLYQHQRRTLFRLHTDEAFYMLAKQGIC